MQSREPEPRVQRDDPDSLAPLQIERLSVDDEVARMSRGKSRQLLGLGAVVSLCAAIAGVWLTGLDSHRTYADAIGSARELDERHAEAFTRCALPGIPSSRLGSSEQLHSAIERISERLGKSYGRSLSRCTPRLTGLVTGLRELSIPAEAGLRAAARDAAAALEQAWQDYARYLLDERTPYDYVQALPRVEKIALASRAYDRRMTELESALRKRL